MKNIKRKTKSATAQVIYGCTIGAAVAPLKGASKLLGVTARGLIAAGEWCEGKSQRAQAKSDTIREKATKRLFLKMAEAHLTPEEAAQMRRIFGKPEQPTLAPDQGLGLVPA